MNKVIFTREQLYDLVWKQPLLTLSKKYNISDVGLRKVCVRMGVPLPNAGYWAKVQHGQTPSIKALLSDHYGQKEITLYLRDENHPSVVDGLPPVAAMQQAIERDYAADLIVKPNLTDPDPLIAKAQTALMKRTKYYKVGDLLSTERGQLDIRVSDPQITRALCLMDAFVKVMRKRGHDFIFKNDNTYIVIGKEEIQMTFREATNAVIGEDRWSTRSYKPNGILTIRFGYHEPSVTGKDGKIPIEQQLAKIIARLELMADEERIKSEEHKIWLDAYHEKERLEKLAAERKKLEITSFQKAMRDASRWQEANTLRAYIDEVEQQLSLVENPGEEMLTWIDWARKKADWYDPLIENSDEWLKGIARDTIMNYELVRQSSYVFDTANNEVPQNKPQWPLLPWYLKK